MLPRLTEPNEEVQLDIAGPISFEEHKQNYYLLDSVDQYSRFPHAQVFKDCEHKQLLTTLKNIANFTPYQDPSTATKRKLSKLEKLTFLSTQKYQTNSGSHRRP